MAPDPFLGRLLRGTYQVERPLGAGGMGQVYVARHTRTGRAYALKVLHGTAALSPDAVARFRREADVLAALGHPGIVAIHDFDQADDGTPYLVMDLLDGQSLAEYLAATGPLAWPDARRLALDVASALMAAHAAGFVHRDLKPANIFLARAPGAPARPVLLDFGIAKAIHPTSAADVRLTRTGAMIGTPMYMSPEQARGGSVDARDDVYSLGAIVFELVAGTTPFRGPTLADVMAQLLTEPPPSIDARVPGRAPHGLDAVLRCALAKDRGQRFPDVRAFAEALARIDGAREPAPFLANTPWPATHGVSTGSQWQPTNVAPPFAATVVSGPPVSATVAMRGPAVVLAPGPSRGRGATAAYLVVIALLVAALGGAGVALVARTRAPREAPTRVQNSEPPPSAGPVLPDPLPAPGPAGDLPVPPPAAAPPSTGLDPTTGRAMQQMRAHDWRGCLQTLATAPQTDTNLNLAWTCAVDLDDPHEMARVCGDATRVAPQSELSQGCGPAVRGRERVHR